MADSKKIENKEAGTLFLELVIENMQASNRILALAAKLHREALNIGIKAAQLGDLAKTFTPITSEISEKMNSLKSLTDNYRLASEKFIEAIAIQVKMLRFASLINTGIHQIIESENPSGKDRIEEYRSSIGSHFNQELDRSLNSIWKLIAELGDGVQLLKQIAVSGRYTSEIALLESAKFGSQNGNLANSSMEISKLFADLTQETKAVENRLLETKKSMKLLSDLSNRSPMEAT